MITKANPGVKGLPRLGIKPQSPIPQPVVTAMNHDNPFIAEVSTNKK